MTDTWEYIAPIVADAATQMAIDAELVERCDGPIPGAFLRFYTMSPPAVTIGRHQRWRAVVDPELCRRHGWEWVRRPTGGGSLLHHRAINYAVAASHSVFHAPQPQSAQTIFRQIADGLLAGLLGLGFQPRLNLSRKERSGGEQISSHGLCGAALTRYEISIDGLKAVAAAQLNLSRASLQHGTIYLHAPGPQDNFWPERSGSTPLPLCQNWWALERADSGHFPDQQTVLADALKAGLADSLGVVWRDNSDSWTNAPEVALRKARWIAEGWHEKR